MKIILTLISQRLTISVVARSIAFLSLLMMLVGWSDIQKELAAKIIELRDSAKYEQALELADIYIGKYRDDPFGYGAKAISLSGMHRIEEAIDYYKKALQYIPEESKRGITYENIANNYIRLNNCDAAIEYYHRAIEADSKLLASSMLGISTVHLLKGDTVRALSNYKRARNSLDESESRLGAAQNANRGRVYIRAAWVAYQLGRNDEALEYAERVKKFAKNDRDRLIFANYLAKLGHIVRAMREFSSVNIDNCPVDNLANFYLIIGDSEKAEKYFDVAYAELKTPEQIMNWKLHLRQQVMFPYDDWAKARNQTWFKTKVQE